MSLQFQANKHQLADLKRLTEIGPEKLAEILDCLSKSPIPTLSPQELVRVLNTLLPDDAEHLARPLLSFYGIIRQTNLGIDVVMQGVRSALEKQGPNEGINTTDWDKVEPIIKDMLQTRSVRLATKGMELAYDYANLLQRTKILTDIRPLFDDAGENIEGAVVSYTLRLRYSNADGSHEMSIAMDDEDIKTLIEQCRRSLQKAKTAKTLMEQQCEIVVSIAGETTND